MSTEKKETLEQRRDRLNKEAIALRKGIKKRRLRLKKVLPALRKARAALARKKVGRGYDVSVHQGNVNHKAAKDSGETWVGIKATEGVGFTDPRFKENMAEAKAVNLRRWAYSFARPDTGGAGDAKAEARSLVNAIKATDQKIISLREWKAGEPGVVGVNDFEHEPFSAEWAKDWAVEYKRLTGVKPVIYGFGSSLNPIAGVAATHYSGVWFAAFVDDWKPFCVDALEDNVIAWQYTASGSVPGVAGNVDRNRWLG